MSVEREKVKNYCTACGRDTNHYVVVGHKISNRDEYMCDILYQVVSCRGAEGSCSDSCFNAAN